MFLKCPRPGVVHRRIRSIMARRADEKLFVTVCKPRRCCHPVGEAGVVSEARERGRRVATAMGYDGACCFSIDSVHTAYEFDFRAFIILDDAERIDPQVLLP